MALNARKQFQQSFNIVNMSNIRGKHVHCVKPDEISFGVLFFRQKLRQSRTFVKLLPTSNIKLDTHSHWVHCIYSTTA